MPNTHRRRLQGAITACKNDASCKFFTAATRELFRWSIQSRFPPKLIHNQLSQKTERNPANEHLVDAIAEVIKAAKQSLANLPAKELERL